MDLLRQGNTISADDWEERPCSHLKFRENFDFYKYFLRNQIVQATSVVENTSMKVEKTKETTPLHYFISSEVKQANLILIQRWREKTCL